MSITQRLSIVRCIIYAMGIAGSEVTNELVGNRTHQLDLKRRRTLYNGNKHSVTEQKRSSLVYCMRGHKLCREAFAHLFELNSHTISRHARKVTLAPKFLLYETRLGESHAGRIGVHRQILDGYLNYIQSTVALECPSGRGSAEDRPVMLLPSDMTRTEVYADYVESFPKLASAAKEHVETAVPDDPLTFSAFSRYWDRGHANLKVSRKGSDFCDLCTSLRSDIDALHESDERHSCLSNLLRDHVSAARREHENYRTVQGYAATKMDGSMQHVVFDYAEKVLLPQLLKQPGHLYFVTGLKFDLFGVHDSNAAKTYIFGLPEGHWPNTKDPNTVLSMLHHVLHCDITSRHKPPKINCLKMHADNCAGQNKNRFVLFYLCWRTIVGLNEDVSLDFMVAGHTKNVVDGAFGHVKRKLKRREARTPREMMDIVEMSSTSSHCIPGSTVNWILWKDYLEVFFKMPTSFSITKFHCFRFDSGHPGCIFAKAYSFSQAEEMFSILGAGTTVHHVRNMAARVFSDPQYRATITPLTAVKSVQQGTRHRYLVHNVVKRYFTEDESLGVQFFENGTNKQ